MILEEIVKDPKTENILKKLEEVKKDSKYSAALLDEINKRIESGHFSFNTTNQIYIYIYMFLCNKLEKVEVLNKLIKDKKFIQLLDETDVEGSMLLSLTSNCQKPRTVLISNARKIKESLLTGDNLLDAKDILEDMTNEEIQILREDIEIDNFLITKGLSFNTIKEETKKRLLNDLNSLSIYNINTIIAFTENFDDLTPLATNHDFLNLYFHKLTEEYNLTNKIFNYMKKEDINCILNTCQKENILLHLVKDTTGPRQKKILEHPRVQKLLETCENDNILEHLPNSFVKEMLVKEKNLFTKRNSKLLERLTKKEISYVLSNNKFYYKQLIEHLKKETKINVSLFITSLPMASSKELCQKHLKEFSIHTIIELLKIDAKTFKVAIIENQEIATKIINESSYAEIKEIFDEGQFEIEEKIKLIKNSTTYQNMANIISMIAHIPLSYRKEIYEIDTLRTKIIKDENYELDEYMTSYFLNHLEELKKASSKTILTMLKSTDYTFAEKIISTKEILSELLQNQINNEEFIQILKENNKLIPLLSKAPNIDLFTKEIVQNLNEHLNYQERKQLCTNELIEYILHEEDLYKIYKSLLNKNSRLLNTLNICFLNEDTKNIKISFLEKITKYPKLQEALLTINKTFKILPEFINTILYQETNLPLNGVLNECINVLKDSCEGINRKKIGNIPRITSVLDTLSKENIHEIISYLLYLIPRYYKKDQIARPIYLETPVTYNDIKYYEQNTNEYLTNKIETGAKEERKEYFIAKHFKCSLEEAKIILNTYSINRIDDTIYKEEYEYLNNLNKIYNTDEDSLLELDKEYKIYSMYDSFVIENKIKKMYGKIFNYEIRSKTYVNHPFIKTLYGKEIKILDCPNDFLFLTSTIDLKEEFLKTNSYLEAWHNTLDKLEKGVKTSLISNDHLLFKEDFVFGFNGLLDEGLLKMSVSNICPCCQEKEQYMTTRELLDNSRDVANTIIIDRYAIRPNYNNSNLPYLEPDYILVDKNKLNDNTYLETISRASIEFKTKRNKDGLPIIAIDIPKIIENEKAKIKQMINRYKKSHDMTILPSILTKLENNYSAYQLYNKEYAENFSITPLLEIIKKRIAESNSNAELNYIEDTFNNECTKYKNVAKEIPCNINKKEIKEWIKERKEWINT